MLVVTREENVPPKSLRVEARPIRVALDLERALKEELIMLDRTLIGRLALGCALLVPILSAPVLAGGRPSISVEMPSELQIPRLEGRHARACARVAGPQHPRR